MVEKKSADFQTRTFQRRLANSLSIYAETLNLKVAIAIQQVGTRLLFTVEELEHPLAIEQQTGISERRAQELASLLLHQERFGWLAKFT